MFLNPFTFHLCLFNQMEQFLIEVDKATNIVITYNRVTYNNEDCTPTSKAKSIKRNIATVFA